MSKQSIAMFLKRVSEDRGFEAELHAAVTGARESVPAILAFAARHGYDFSQDELEETLDAYEAADDELSEGELEHVAGGVGAQTIDDRQLDPGQIIGNTSVPGLVAIGIGGYCFAGEVELRMQDGRTKRFDEVRIGDVLEGGSRVRVVLQFDGFHVPIYDLDGILVAGDHFVLEDGKWTQVRYSKRAMLTDRRVDVLWDIETSDQRIRIGGHVFWDYEDDVLTEAALRAEAARSECGPASKPRAGSTMPASPA
jgi:predicted ribosomally synthesized peptide with nif11-like leader